MFNFIKLFFAKFSKKKSAEISDNIPAVKEEPNFTELQKTVQDKIKNRINMLLIKDNDGEKLKEIKTLLELNGYFIYYINSNERPGPFNIFHNMNESNYNQYVKILSLDNKGKMVENLNGLLLTSVLLSMVESNELSWKGFTNRIANIDRDMPEFITAAVDEKIKNAFRTFKEMVRAINFFHNEFALFNEERFQNAESYIPKGKIAVFYKEYEGDEAFMNKAILLECDEKGRL